MGKINSSQEVKVLRKYFKKDGWKLNRSEADIWDVKENGSGSEYQMSTIPLQPKNKNQSASNISRTLIWFGADAPDRDAVVRESDQNDMTRSIYSINNGEVSREVSDIGERSPPDENIMTDGGKECTHIVEECVDVNWSCVTPMLVEASICTYAALAKQIKEIIACLNGAGWGIIQFIQNEFCSMCDNTDIRRYSTCGGEWEVMPP